MFFKPLEEKIKDIVTGLFKKKTIVPGDIMLPMMENTALCHVFVRTVFQLDGAPPHFSHCVCAFLDREFPVCWIRRWWGDPFPGPLILQV
jgi:hypothetical protein